MGPAGRAARFRERLLRAGYPCQEALYGGLRSCLAQAFGAHTPYWRRRVDGFAAQAWCMAVGRDFFRTKLECPLNSVAKSSRVLAQDGREARMRAFRHPSGSARTLRYRAEDNHRRIGVAFWIQRRRYLTAARVKRIMAGFERFRIEEALPDQGLESTVRYLIFRLRRPGYFERLSYGLDRNGDPDWSQQPWRSLPGYRERWEAARQREAEARRKSEPPTYPKTGLVGPRLASAKLGDREPLGFVQGHELPEEQGRMVVSAEADPPARPGRARVGPTSCFGAISPEADSSQPSAQRASSQTRVVRIREAASRVIDHVSRWFSSRGKS